MSVQLANRGQLDLARAVQAFAPQMNPPLSEKEVVKATLLEKALARDSQDRQLQQAVRPPQASNFRNQRFAETTQPQPFRAGILWE